MSQPVQQSGMAYPVPPTEPTFQVSTATHTGAMVIWINQRRTTAGTYAQCTAAINTAQQHCMVLGWWSIGSLLWNPISLAHNLAARKSLRLQAQRAHDYALWWAIYHGGPQHTVWTPPVDAPTRAKWWVWIPVAVAAAIVAMFVLMVIIGVANHDDRHHGTDQQWSPAPTLSTSTN